MSRRFSLARTHREKLNMSNHRNRRNRHIINTYAQFYLGHYRATSISQDVPKGRGTQLCVSFSQLFIPLCSKKWRFRLLCKIKVCKMSFETCNQFHAICKLIICNSIDLSRFTFKSMPDLRIITMSRDRRRYFLPRLLKKCGRRSCVMILNKRNIKRGATASISFRRSLFYSFSGGGGSGKRSEDWTKLKSRRCCRDGNCEIALPTLIFKNAKLQEARGQINPPRRCRPWGIGRRYNG